jgi:uncharacterized cupredoxin-like copper-binding protein
MTTRRSLLILAGLFPLASRIAFAHGDQHSKKPKTVKKDQKPWGIAGDKKSVSRTIAISMTDTMRFNPDKVTIKKNETIRFMLANNGKMLHEFVIGTKSELDEHAALMLKFPNMEHDEPYMAHVPPGKKGQIVWQFNRAGDFDFACLIAGHYQAGMVGKIHVIAS